MVEGLILLHVSSIALYRRATTIGTTNRSEIGLIAVYAFLLVLLWTDNDIERFLNPNLSHRVG